MQTVNKETLSLATLKGFLKPLVSNFKNKPIKILVYLMLILSLLLIFRPSYLYVKSVAAQVLLDHAWEKSKQGEGNIRPWQWADSYPVAKLSYDHGKHSWIILAGMTGRTMAFAPSWLEDSAKPNQYGNTVISAHNDSHFSVLDKVEIGELLLLEDRQGVVLAYQVISIDIVMETDISPYQFEDETMLTLITCYPFEVTNRNKKQRLIVRALQV